MKRKSKLENGGTFADSELQQMPQGSDSFTLGDLYSDKPSNDSILNERWYTSLPPDPKEFPSSPNDVTNQLKQEAKTMLDSETNGYNIKSNKNSEKKWMRSVMAKGTGRDRIAALTLMVQEKPMYNMQSLKSLIGLVRPAKKECPVAIDTLVELFTTDLLPPNKKLRAFGQRPLSILDQISSGNPVGRRRRLIAWYFEDLLKETFKEFLDSLRIVAGDAIEANKEKSIKAMALLLESHPEQEAVLLTNIINKLGDPCKKVAAKALHGLTQVLRKHPNMKGIIVNEIEKLLFRSNIGNKARYYSMCFLSQITYSRSDTKLAANVIKIYFSFFKACVKLGEVDSKMLSILLTGVNRAYPYAKAALDSITEQLETLYKLVHIAPMHASLQALALLFQVCDYKSNVSDRFFSVLYRKLLDPELAVTSHAPMFLNLTFQALKKDESIPRVRVLIKRLLQICCYFPAPMACATLYMVSQVMNKQPALSAISFDFNIKEEKHGSGEKQGATAEAFLEDDSGDEHYDDVTLDEKETSKNTKEKDKTNPPVSWIHKPEGKKDVKKLGYDPMHRNPLYAGGEVCTHTELVHLTKHFHPTVALFANDILSNSLITYSGDPLQDFALIRFLDRFSFKNPKKQPEAPSKSLFAKRQNYAVAGVKSLPINSYASQEERKVPVDEMYLFRYLQQRRMAAEEFDKKEKDDDNDDIESVASDEFEDMIEDLLKKRGFKTDYDDDDIDPDMDFADEYSKNATAKKSKKKIVEEEDRDMSGSDVTDDLDDMEDEDNIDDDDDDGKNIDGESDFDDDEDLNGDDEDMPSDFDFDEDVEDLDFGSGSEDEKPSSAPSKGKEKKKSKKIDMDGVFASAEEFSELLDAASSAREGTLGAFANKDKASMKQLNWEDNRDRWVKGFNGNKKGPKSFSGKKSKPLGVKKSAFKSKGKRRF